MQVLVTDKKLKKTLETEKSRQKAYGAEMAKKLKLRIGALDAAESLADFWPPKSKPERCHELSPGRPGTFSMDLVHPHRLLFQLVGSFSTQPTGNEEKPDQAANDNNDKERWRAIDAVDITSIEDTHG